MWKRTHTKLYPDLNAEDVWHVMTDINKWPLWHDDLEACTFHGGFEVGNYFTLTPKGMKPIKILLTEIIHGHTFTDCTKFPGATMIDIHEVKQEGDNIRLTNTVIVKGPLRWLWVKLVAQHVADSTPSEMDALIRRTKAMTP